jgi:transposase
MTIETLGIDIAKNVFQLHGVNRNVRVVLKRRVMRDQLLAVLAQIGPCTVVIEACTVRSTGRVSLRRSVIG